MIGPLTIQIGIVFLCVFVPLFIVALVMMKSVRRAFSVAAVFAAGSTLGYVLAGAASQWAVGREVAQETRQAMMIAFSAAGAAAGGAIALWAFLRRTRPIA
jgi:hypothetical protein